MEEKKNLEFQLVYSHSTNQSVNVLRRVIHRLRAFSDFGYLVDGHSLQVNPYDR